MSMDLDTARDIALHPGGRTRSMVALAADVVVAELDKRGAAIERVRRMATEAVEYQGDAAWVDVAGLRAALDGTRARQ